jgi:hypothetical protein
MLRCRHQKGHVKNLRCTIGIGRFDKCMKHTANLEKHSAKFLPSDTLGKEGPTNSTSAKTSLPSTFYRALGKEKRPSRRRGDGDGAFAECLGDTRQRSYLFAECLPTSTRQMIYLWVPFVRFFVECSRRHSAKLAFLPSARARALGKDAIPVLRYWFFAECNTRQSDQYTGATRLSANVTTVTFRRWLTVLCRESLFVECRALDSTPVPRVLLSANAFVTESRTLPSTVLDKGFFAECPTKSTRQNAEHSAKARIPVVVTISF